MYTTRSKLFFIDFALHSSPRGALRRYLRGGENTRFYFFILIHDMTQRGGGCMVAQGGGGCGPDMSSRGQENIEWNRKRQKVGET